MFNSSNGTNFTMPVVPQGTNGDGFGNGFGNGGWWIILLLIIIFGWNNNGNWGGYGNRGGGSDQPVIVNTAGTPSMPMLAYGNGGGTGSIDNYVLASDMSMLSRQIADSASMTERKLDGVNNGLCSGFYENAQLINGLKGAITDSNYALQSSLTQGQITAMQNQNALQTQISQCCCDNKSALKDIQYNLATLNNGTNTMIGTQFADLNYRIATEDCTTRRTITDNARDVITSQDNSTRAILAAIQSIKDDAKDEKIANLQTQLAESRLIANNNNQTAIFTAALNDAVNKIQPCPVPAYSVPAPYPYVNCNCNSGCGC